MQRAGLYIRVSTEEQAIHGLSVEAQTEALDAWAKKSQVKVIDHYIDAGISARKKAEKRPDLQRLLMDIKAGRVDLVVFTKLDRWFRNIGEYYKVQEVLDDHGVAWQAIHEDYDTTTASGRLKVNIMLSVAQDEADRTAERIKVVFDEKRKKLEPVTGHVPLGYRIEGKSIVYDDERRAQVQVFFDTYLTTGSVKSALDASGKSIYYRLADQMLKNRAYYGCFNATDGMCPAYITKDQYDLIQTMRKARPRTPADPSRVYLFSGILRCAECGDRMAARTQLSEHKDGTHTDVRYYQCNRHWRYGPQGCPNGSCLSEKRIEEEVLRQLPVALAEIQAETDSRNRGIKQNSADLSKIKRKQKRLQELYLNDLIDMDDYKVQYAALVAEKERLEKEKPHTIAAAELLTAGWRELYDKLEGELKRAFWLTVTEKITVGVNREIRVILR